MSEPRYIIPQNVHTEKLYDPRIYGYTDQMLDKLIIELKQCPTFITYLKTRLIDNACNLMLEVNQYTPNELKENINANYAGRNKELGELLKLAQSVINPNYKEE